jgi:protein-glucosylgalactosylhydroxylysine glucosidase
MRLTIRRAVPAVAWYLALAAVAAAAPRGPERIDRRAVVSRHAPVLRALDPDSPLSVGNGHFAFTADVTGLQTFAESYERTVPLGTLSDWGWHRFPNPERWTIDSFRFNEFDSHGRTVGYADIPGNEQTPEIRWLRANPHRLHLGRLAFDLRARDGRPARPDDISDVEQTLDLWTGILTSRFSFDGERVEVQTACHPAIDAVSVRVRSPLVRDGRLAIRVAFPYGTGDVKTADWSRPDAHRTTLVHQGPNAARFDRRLDADRYLVLAAWQPRAAIEERGRHEFLVRPASRQDVFEFSAAFHPAGVAAPGPAPAFDRTLAASRAHWARFWSSGGAVDLSGSRDSRWRELERRIVLSQYLTAIQCAGSTPPQETGLTYNSWEGKFHLEMHWWHAAHFALWNRLPLLERSLAYYRRILPRAQATASRQGYRGARWPKMTDPGGAESPSGVGPFLVWQQPHPIFYAELVYRAHPTSATLSRFAKVVRETGEFMASYPVRDAASGRFVLGPPLQCAQEVFPKAETTDCTFEIAYWRWGLETAQRWRERMKLPRDARWDVVLAGLPNLPVRDGKYLFAGNVPDTYENPRWRRDHPVVVGAFGFLPGTGVDRDTMRRTFDWIWDNWNWPDTWGWDYPLMAMTAARLGDGRRAVDALLLDTPKNVYRPNGHNYQRPGLTIYLPGNGGLLYAVAMMAAGWEGGPDRRAPGFPDDGSWVVRYEGLRKAF